MSNAETRSASETGQTPADSDAGQFMGPQPLQSEMPFAMVQGEAVTTLPQDLYIPPDALEVFLEAFEGPLDLLLYMIRRQNLDVLEIPIAEITKQYMEYIELMQELRLELAAEYLVMAAMLAEIKSRMLLPRPVEEDEEVDDPRAELVRRLQEYERFKQAAEDINELPRMGRDTWPVSANVVERQVLKIEPDVNMKELIMAFRDVLVRSEMFSHHQIEMEALSVRERMSMVLSNVKADSFTDFTDLFDVKEGRMGVVVTFLAILELIKESLLELVQSEPYAPIHVKAAGSASSE
jgi:segregation and condensation protein A